LEEQNRYLLQKFEKFLLDNLPTASSFHPTYEKALKEMLYAGGKRFRPLLLLNVVESYSPLLVQSSLSVASAIEMLHTYSLIHDDLPSFDNADLRRGKPTLHVTYDEVIATLVGDALNTHSFFMIANASLCSDVKIALIKELSLNGGADGMVLGQAIDCYFEDKPLDIEQLSFLHTHKTAKLIATSLKMGAIIVDLDKNTQNLLYEIGLKIGLLFQVQDDIIDVTQSEEEAGKTTNNDQNKNSFTNLLGIEGALEHKNRLILEIEVDINKLNDNLSYRLQNMIDIYFK
jgi:farnesyl diphosphate synthase